MTKQRLLSLVLLLLLTAALLLSGCSKEPDFVIPEHIVICLDAGHGGDDPGAVFGERQEKEDNLAVILAVKAALEAQTEHA